MRKSLTVFLSGVALVYAASTALAGEHVLEFKLVTKPLDVDEFLRVVDRFVPVRRAGA